jgi:uncharacterized protein (TIGR02996 family)
MAVAMALIDTLGKEAASGSLQSALASWQETRATALGEFISRYPAGPAFKPPRGSEAGLVAWTDGWTRGTNADRSALAKALPALFRSMTHRYAKGLMRFLQEQPADPRLGDALAPLTSAHADRPMVQKEWRLAFVHHADQRHLRQLEALRVTRAESVAVGKLITRLRATPADGKLAASLSKLRFGAEQVKAAVADELFAAVYAAPNDLALRGVLADALIEAEDPRGAFIAEQLAGKARAPKSAELRAMLLGPLDAALEPESVTFRNGFPVSGTVREKLSTPHQQTLLRRPEWSTFETVWGLARLSPTLVSLRETGTLPGKALSEWGKQGWPLPLVSFGVHLEEVSLVLALPTQPTALRLALTIDDIEYDHELAPLAKCSSLERLTFGPAYAPVNDSWPEWTAELADVLPQVREVRWQLEGGEVAVRSTKRRFDTLEVVANTKDFTVDLGSFQPVSSGDKVVSGRFAADVAKRLKGFRVAS